MIRKGMSEAATDHFQMAQKIDPGNELAQKYLTQILQAPVRHNEEIVQKQN
jgi:hypothetical protein